MVAAAAGCRCAIALPDDAAAEKGALLRALGADVARVPPVSIAHPDHFVNVARRVGPPAGPPATCPAVCAVRAGWAHLCLVRLLVAPACEECV